MNSEYKLLCHKCVGNEDYKDIIKTEKTPDNCSYCGKRRFCLNLEEIAKHVDAEYTENYTQSVDDPSVGDSPNYLIQELLGCEENIAHDLIDILEGYDEFRAMDGGDVYYDITSNYLPIHRYEYWRPEEWVDFCNKVKHTQRYFNEDVLSELEEHFENINNALSEYGKTPIIEIGPESSIEAIYRARKVEDEETRIKITNNPSEQLGPPPATIISLGRMNPIGIPVFYGALEEHTCIAEIRSSVGALAAIGKFAIKRTLKILDLTVFNEGFLEPGLHSFIVSFHKDISKPILPRDKALDYIPTQVVTEYLANKHELDFDGIIYSSAQTDAEGKNIALFNKTIRYDVNNTIEYVDDSFELVVIESIQYDYGPPTIDEPTEDELLDISSIADIFTDN